jgi:hypothetical protein
MAGNAQANLMVNPYVLGGIDPTGRSMIVEGIILPVVATGATYAIKAFSLVTNVVTFTANNALTAGGGQVIVVAGFTGANFYLNGVYTTTSATATTIVVPLTHANASGIATGAATVQGTYTAGGIPINYGFVNGGGQPSAIGSIGPKSTVKWIDVQSLAGSAFNYKTNISVTPNKLLIFNGITEATDAAAVPNDTVGFRAEFVKNAY